MKAYKGFNKDMTCRGFQFKEGKTYKTREAKLCECGFHACEEPLDVFNYYPPSISEYHEVELDDVSDERGDDTKVCAKKIKIGAKLSIKKLIKLQIEYTKARCTNEHNAEHGEPATAGDCGAATAGNHGVATAGDCGAATAGDCGVATAGDRGVATAGDRGVATAGDCGAATAGNCGVATAGDRGVATAGDCGAATAGNCGAATAGDCGAATAGDCGAATAGDCGAATAGNCGAATAGNHGVATAGDRGVATAGDCGAATAGNHGAATSRGSVSVGVSGAALVRGDNVRAKGELGSVIVIVEEMDDSCDIYEWKAGVIDGEVLKPNTLYKLENGEFVECDED